MSWDELFRVLVWVFFLFAARETVLDIRNLSKTYFYYRAYKISLRSNRDAVVQVLGSVVMAACTAAVALTALWVAWGLR